MMCVDRQTDKQTRAKHVPPPLLEVIMICQTLLWPITSSDFSATFFYHQHKVGLSYIDVGQSGVGVAFRLQCFRLTE